MIKLRNLKNSCAKLNENYKYSITEEDEQERFLTKILDEAIKEFERDGEQTISFEDWIKEMKEEYNVIL